MARPQKASDEQLVAAYAESSSVVAVGKLFGMCGQSVHERLSTLGVTRPINVFTAAEVERLSREYTIFAQRGQLQRLADDMGRTRHFLCRQARILGLTDIKHARPYTAVWKYMTDVAAEVIWADFKACSLGVGMYCKKRGYDDLGFSRTMRKKFADEWDHVIELKAPKQSLYRIGRAFEYRVRDDLRTFGFFVMRSPQSKSPTDLIAIRPDLNLFVQCKRTGTMAVEEWNEFYELCLSSGAVPLLARMPARQGIEYFRIIGRKDGSKHRQPYEPYTVPEKP